MSRSGGRLGRVALVTGGSGGIGAAVARRLRAEGLRVAVADLHAPDEGVADHYERSDVSDDEAVASLFSVVEEYLGRVEVLVNNAGIAHGPRSERHFLDTDPAMWDELMAVNLRSVYLCSSRCARSLARAGTPGCIVNVSTAGATRAHRHRVAYDAAKGAIEAATRAMALDLAPYDIRVNAVAPGAVAVPARTPVGAESGVAADQVVPLGRLGTPEDVAGVVAFLASDDAAYLTGVSVPVDGGLLAQLRSPAIDLPARPSP